MEKETARDIRHAIAEAMAAEGLLWGGRQDYAVGVALAAVSLPTAQSTHQPSLEETRASLTRAERALRKIGAYTKDRYVIQCVSEGLGEEP